MSIPGKRIKVPQMIHSDTCAVMVQVDAVIPDADPSEPCFEPEAIRLMDDLQELADAGDIESLKRFGPVYVRQSA